MKADLLAQRVTNQEVGKIGEDIACRVLADNGWSIISRNWRCRYGEIDVIAVKGQEISFIEVKTRRGKSHGSGIQAIDPRKLNRIRKLARLWLQSSSDFFTQINIDALEVQLHDDLSSKVRYFREVA
ncbi:hypothetical protein BK816_03900 [Boudabousia tangfeifanii]|uniref:UPF0102 protein BK816_03900 n=1 Tax=Boudabousia tangfeifanii TaxID=1912795 RepID=A0A1D9MJT3_9ACTO|nr:YraN family protein [Boudabousia tangfeifanii]AOZ72546.1 hypothetical protein BK816_03900 [Boudabousia tangfeifanii]